MKIKGSAALARKEIVTRRFGADAWARLLDDVGAEHPCFREPLVASSLLPVRAFLALHDELVRRFFGGDDQIYFRLGEESADWALMKGPYRRFLARKDLEAFVASIPSLSSAYWEETTTTYEAKLEGDVVELRVAGLPEWHPYFEYLVVGYIKHALELLCGMPVAADALAGGAGTSYHYRFRLPSRPDALAQHSARR